METDSGTARLRIFSDLQPEDLAKLRGMVGPARSFARNQPIRAEGDEHPAVYLLLSGCVASSLMSPSGERQIVKVHMPGDLLGVPSLAFVRAVDTLIPLSSALVRSISPKAIGEMFERDARLAALLFLITQEERVALMDRVAASGVNDTGKRVAALILELHARLERNHPGIGLTFQLPLTQAAIGEIIGASSVHVSRVLKQLRLAHLVDWRNGSVTIHDLAEVRDYAGTTSRELAHEPAWLPLAS